MIRKLFNNRAFIIGLAICSGLLMVRSLAAPFLDEPDFADVEAPVFDPDGEALAELEVVATDKTAPAAEETIWRADQSVLSGQLTWNEAPQRDPFASPGKSPDAKVSIETTASLPTVVGMPRLDALVAGPDSLFAVLNDQIVREGDLVGGYEVTRIASDGVRIASRFESHWLAWQTAESRVADSQAHLNGRR
jgi:hypothetical protein